MPVRFSSRTAWETAENALATAIREARACGRVLLDLTVSNPTVCGFHYDESLLGPLRNPASLVYDPAPRGILSARVAVAGYYAQHGAAIDPGDLLLTTSTSEAYSFLFRLLCDAGDAVLVAQPGYPLFDFLADLDDVHIIPYPLFYDFGWWIDFAELERRITPRTRALIVVHPNNPTGHATSRADRERLEQLCVRHGLALIVDEVFLDYGIESIGIEARIESFATDLHPCLTFVVSGLSKIAALPQMKVGWIAAFGPDEERHAALARLEIVADTFLSMNAPAQHALPVWLAGKEVVAKQIRSRVGENLRTIIGVVEALPVHAGWSAILRIPQRMGCVGLAERLVHEAGLITHPGSFYGMPQNNLIVVSLLTPPGDFQRGLEILNQWCEPEELT